MPEKVTIELGKCAFVKGTTQTVWIPYIPDRAFHVETIEIGYQSNRPDLLPEVCIGPMRIGTKAVKSCQKSEPLKQNPQKFKVGQKVVPGVYLNILVTLPEALQDDKDRVDVTAKAVGMWI